MTDALLVLGVVAVCVAMLWLSVKLEPHWVSKDGSRLICYGQGLTRAGMPVGRWRELRIMRVSDEAVEVRPRRGSLTAEPNTANVGVKNWITRAGRKPSYWRVSGRTESTSKRKVVYMLVSCSDPEAPDMLAVRMPATSKAVPMFEALAINKSPVSASPPNRESPSAEAQPGQG